MGTGPAMFSMDFTLGPPASWPQGEYWDGFGDPPPGWVQCRVSCQWDGEHATGRTLLGLAADLAVARGIREYGGTDPAVGRASPYPADDLRAEIARRRLATFRGDAGGYPATFVRRGGRWDVVRTRAELAELLEG